MLHRASKAEEQVIAVRRDMRRRVGSHARDDGHKHITVELKPTADTIGTVDALSACQVNRSGVLALYLDPIECDNNRNNQNE